MAWLRKALLHSIVWLTVAATVLAGTPQVRCCCSSGAMKAICLAPVDVEKPCCCCVAVADEEETRPSCCQEPATTDEATGPVLGHDSCHKTLIQPADATAQRGNVEVQQFANQFVAEFDYLVSICTKISHSRGAASPRLPPPIDLQLVLQHFLI